MDADGGPDTDLSSLDRQLLDGFQREFPLVPRPFAAVAVRLQAQEADVLQRLSDLRASGRISRVGATIAPNTAGASTLAAMAVPATRLDEVAELVNGYPEVNHNYEREHRLNLWFVVAADDRARVDAVLADISQRTGLEVLDLPMERAFHLDLGFGLKWR